jgi:hypothetical protein
MVTPFQAKTNFLTLRFFYPAALGAQKTARTASPSLGDVNVEGLDPKGAAQTGTIALGWAGPISCQFVLADACISSAIER